ncbi:hypothetical protein ACFUJR_24595 [Streptomyces sp. NPDC057271]
MDTVFAEHLDNERRTPDAMSPAERRRLAPLPRKLETSILDSDEPQATPG